MVWRRTHWLGLVALSLLTVSSASADPGEHIRAGDATFAPKLTVAIEHSTNAYKSEVVAPGGGATNMRLAPGLDARLNRDDIDFSLQSEYSLRKYFAAADTNLDRYTDFSIGADVDALKQSVIGLRAHEAVGLLNNPMDTGWSDHPFLTQFRNQSTGAIAIRPGPAFELSLGGSYTMDDYQVPAGETGVGNSRHYDTRHTFGPTAGLAWKFFPRTAVAVDFSYQHAYFMDTVVIEGGGAPIPLPDHNMLRLSGGLRGRVTDKLIVTLMGGYGKAVFNTASVADLTTAAANVTGAQHVLVDTSFRYEVTNDSRVVVGFQKDFRDSFFTNYVAYSKGYAIADLKFTERVGVSGEFDVAGEEFRGNTDRNDLVFMAKGDGTYYMRDWASIVLGAAWQERSSQADNVEYDDVNVHLQANFVY